MSNDLTRLRDRLGRDPQPWTPDVGDSVLGTVIEVDERLSEYGPYPAITVETDDGEEFIIAAYHTALRNEIGRHDIRPGDIFGARYGGKVESKSGGSSYHAYRCVYERGDRPDETGPCPEAGDPPPVPPAPAVRNFEPFPDDE